MLGWLKTVFYGKSLAYVFFYVLPRCGQAGLGANQGLLEVFKANANVFDDSATAPPYHEGCYLIKNELILT